VDGRRRRCSGEVDRRLSGAGTSAESGAAAGPSGTRGRGRGFMGRRLDDPTSSTPYVAPGWKATRDGGGGAGERSSDDLADDPDADSDDVKSNEGSDAESESEHGARGTGMCALAGMPGIHANAPVSIMRPAGVVKRREGAKGWAGCVSFAAVSGPASLGATEEVACWIGRGA
jgi:hypothetical protein